MIVGTVSALWRYPVKSMLGERLTAAQIPERGVVGDRLYAVRTIDNKLGSGKSSRRFRRMDGLISLRARYNNGARPIVADIDGKPVENDEKLRRFLGLDDVRLSVESDIMHFDSSPLHLLTTATVAATAGTVPDVAIDERRFRPNILIDTGTQQGFLEDSWVGRTARIGTHVAVAFSKKTERCVMTTMAQEGLPHSSDVLRNLQAVNEMCAGIYATVLNGGTVRLGDEMRFFPLS